MKNILLIILLAFVSTLFQKCSDRGNDVHDMNGWHLVGADIGSYQLSIDTAKINSQQVFYLKSISNAAEKTGTAENELNAFNYLGKRVRLSSNIKTANLDNSVQMFMRVDGGPGAGLVGKTLAFDDMQNRVIRGTTEWQKYEIVLDIPQETKSVLYGFHLNGSGEAWFSGVNVEIVGNNVPSTDMMKK